MINKDRIVPVQATTLIDLYALILNASGVSTLAAESAKNPAQFEIEAAATPLICDEPVAICDIAETVSAATIYFVPAYDYAGFTVGGEAVDVTGTVEADGCSLYKATLASGAITIVKVGL